MDLSRLIVVAVIGLCCGMATPTLGQTSAPAQSAAPAAAPALDDTYILDANDVIEVSVLGRTDFTTRARIGSDGVIQLPYLGPVVATKKTTKQLADEIGHALEAGGYFAHPILKVEVVSYGSRYAVVLGSVTTPGLVPIDRAYRLSEMIARAGGVRAEGADYVILRPVGGPEKRYSIVGFATGDASEDPYVQSGDKIFVPPADQFYVSGEVKSPGAYALASDMTIRMAISRGGGLTDSGSEHRVRVTRRGVKLDHPDLDSKIEPGDVIVVGQSIF